MVLADVVDNLSRIGAIGGILSIVGVGLLILLVAGQSRQIRSMREWIEEEPQRQAETAQRVIAEVQRRIAAARERRQGPPQAPAVPAAPVARGASPAPGTLGATPEAQAIARAQELVPATGAEGTEGSIPPPGEPPRFAPLTPAGGALPEEPDDDLPAVVSETLNQETQAADAIPEADLLDPDAGAATTRAASDVRFGEELYDEEEPHSNRLVFGAGALALLAGIVLLGFVLFGGGGGDKSGSGPQKADTGSSSGQTGGGGSKQPAASTPKTIDPSTVSVKVLNGTSVSGLAQRVTDRLDQAGYTTTAPDTFSNGGAVLSNTTVYYRSGYKTAATQLARRLGASASNVQSMTSTVSVAASQAANVAVIIGTDMNNAAGASGTTGTSTG